MGKETEPLTSNASDSPAVEPSSGMMPKAKRPRVPRSTPDQRQAIARKAANARWSKKNAPEKAIRVPRHYQKHTLKTALTHAAFGDALAAAENRLAAAVQERADLANVTGGLDAEIYWLIQTIAVLKNPQNPQMPQTSLPASLASAYNMPAYNPQPIPTRGPQLSRAQGTAVGINLGDEVNENQFLDAANLPGGEWH